MLPYAAMPALDLLITVDTSTAHLAGALGLPVWIVLAKPPDWRWQLDRPNLPWYPSARLYRAHGDPAGVSRKIAEDLEAFVAG